MCNRHVDYFKTLLRVNIARPAARCKTRSRRARTQPTPRNPPRRRRSRGNPMRQLLLDFDRAPTPTFANFVTGGNAELSYALETAAGGSFAERVIYVWGEAGAGKTHLLRAFAAAAPGARYLRAKELGEEDMRGVLAVDDIEKLPEDRQVALFNAFNERAFDFLLVSAGS